MKYFDYFESPLGRMTIIADDGKLIEAYFDNQKGCKVMDSAAEQSQNCPVLIETKRWLARYFNGEKPDCKELNLSPRGSEFSERVWEQLCGIPYGATVSYGKIAKETAKLMGVARMSAQAVGGAIGRNPIAIIVPCHRVIGADGDVTGYAAGIDKKLWLLELEGIKLPLPCRNN